MKSNQFSLKQGVFVLALTALSVLSVYYLSKPFYIGYVGALVLALLAGLITKQWWGVLPGLIGTSAGLYLLHQLPQEVSEKRLEDYQNYLSFTADNYWWMVAAAVLLGGLGIYLAKKVAPQSEDNSQDSNASDLAAPLIEKPHMDTHELTLMSMFVALSVAINTVRIGSVSFGGFPIIFSGYVLGPIPGFIVGAVADLVGFIIRPSSFGFNPIFTLTSALTGLIPVVITRLLGEKYPKYSFVKVLLGIFVGQVLTSVLLAPFFSTLLYKREESFLLTFWIKASKAGIKQAVSIPIYAFLIVSVIEAISKTVKVNRPRRRQVLPSKEA